MKLILPENPYPADIFPATREELAARFPDETERTAIFGGFGRAFYEILVPDTLASVAKQVEDYLNGPCEHDPPWRRRLCRRCIAELMPALREAQEQNSALK